MIHFHKINSLQGLTFYQTNTGIWCYLNTLKGQDMPVDISPAHKIFIIKDNYFIKAFHVIPYYDRGRDNVHVTVLLRGDSVKVVLLELQINGNTISVINQEELTLSREVRNG